MKNSLPEWVKNHINLYLKDGEAGHYWDASIRGGHGMLTTLLLTTTGRRSGKQSIIPLIYRPTDSGSYCIIASKGGASDHPAWFLNIEANPKVHIQVVNDKFNAVARIAEGEERDKLWELMADYYPRYNDYQAAAQRKIPVVVLDVV